MSPFVCLCSFVMFVHVLLMFLCSSALMFSCSYYFYFSIVEAKLVDVGSERAQSETEADSKRNWREYKWNRCGNSCEINVIIMMWSWCITEGIARWWDWCEIAVKLKWSWTNIEANTKWVRNETKPSTLHLMSHALWPHEPSHLRSTPLPPFHIPHPYPSPSLSHSPQVSKSDPPRIPQI